MHSSGVIQGGKAHLFLGPSGLGKSTVCKLLAQEPSFQVLHDDMTVVSRKGAEFFVWSTPLSGEMPAESSSNAPLEAVFSLKHDQTNYIQRLSRKKAAGLLALGLVPPLVPKNGSLVVEPTESLKLLLEMAEAVPCYELHFRPEPDFWKCIPQLLEKESLNYKGKDIISGL